MFGVKGFFATVSTVLHLEVGQTEASFYKAKRSFFLFFSFFGVGVGIGWKLRQTIKAATKLLGGKNIRCNHVLVTRGGRGGKHGTIFGLFCCKAMACLVTHFKISTLAFQPVSIEATGPEERLK